MRLALLFVLPLLVFAAPRKQTGLDRYVAAPDPSFSWKLATTIPGQSTTAYILDMTSQTWKANDMNRGQWKHWVSIVKPAKVTSNVAFLMITGGANDGRPRNSVDPLMTAIAQYTGAVVAELRMVPNQPLIFNDDPAKRPRTEDSFIAYTWNNYLKTGDETWPARMPMTKAAVRAMDTVTAFLKEQNTPIDKFVVAGASKRGWTPWTTAAVDQRVVAFMPLVIDLLNIIPNFVHHYRAYGFWAPSVGDYFEQGLMDKMNDPRYKSLMKLVEPYHYRDRFTQPKFLVHGAGDQFFLPDSWKFYWKDLKGEKHLRYVPNTDHSLRNSDAPDSITAFYNAVIKNEPRPVYSWKVKKDLTIELQSTTKPTAVKLWQATNPDARDFRLETLGPKYSSTELQPDKNGRYSAKPAAPAKGYTAYFLEMTYPSSGSKPFKFSTGVVVTPDTYPFGPPIPGQTKVGAVPPRRR
jgi:PhoPQ-activated pathogenicity-related protein